MMTSTEPTLASLPRSVARAPTVPAFFRALGERIETEWDAAKRDPRSFASIATAALEAARPADHFDYMDLVSWVHSTNELPAQADLESKFGEPPVTLFVSKSKLFHVSALHWVDGTTSVHQHAFSGAFHVLYGSSIHCRYGFTTTRRFDAHLMAGKLEVRDVELLARGVTRPIVSGGDFIHSLFHLDRPSVTIVVRTVRDEGAGPQFDYTPPGLAFDPYRKPLAAVRSVQLLRMLHRVEHEGFAARAAALVARSEPIAAYLVLDEVFRCLKRADEFAAFLEACRPHHPDLVEALVPVYAQRRREYKIVARRAKVHSPEHRYLLALLMNLTKRRDMLALVEARYPGSSPTERIARWVRELAAADEEQAGSGLGLELGEAELAVFELALEGLSVDAIAQRLGREYDAAAVSAQLPLIASLCEAFRRSVLLGPLFACSPRTGAQGSR